VITFSIGLPSHAVVRKTQYRQRRSFKGEFSLLGLMIHGFVVFFMKILSGTGLHFRATLTNTIIKRTVSRRYIFKMPIFTLNISTHIKNMRYYFDRDNVNLTNITSWYSSPVAIYYFLLFHLSRVFGRIFSQDGLCRIFSKHLQNFHLPTNRSKDTETGISTNILKLKPDS
jgi:hypothetical protein